MANTGKSPSRYDTLIEALFHDHHKPGTAELFFDLSELRAGADRLSVMNPLDVVYIYAGRRRLLPASITATAGAGAEWTLEKAGPARYVFRLVPVTVADSSDD